MSIDDEIEKRDEDDPLHPDQLPGNVAKDLYEGPDVGGEKQHDAEIDLEWERNKEFYNKEEYGRSEGE